MKKLLFLAAAFSGFALIVSDVNAAETRKQQARRLAQEAEQARLAQEEARRQALLAEIRAANPVDAHESQLQNQHPEVDADIESENVSNSVIDDNQTPVNNDQNQPQENQELNLDPAILNAIILDPATIKAMINENEAEELKKIAEDLQKASAQKNTKKILADGTILEDASDTDSDNEFSDQEEQDSQSNYQEDPKLNTGSDTDTDSDASNDDAQEEQDNQNNNVPAHQPAGQSYWQWLVEKTQTGATATQQWITANPKTSITIGGVTITIGALYADYKIRGENSVLSKVYRYFKNKSDKQALLEQKLADARKNSK